MAQPPTPSSPPAGESARGAAVPGRRSVTKIIRSVVAAAAAAEQDPSGRARRVITYPVFALRVLLQVIRSWARDRCPQKAASLAFQTMVSLVPLTAVALTILRATGAFEEQSSLVAFLAQEVIPVSREEIAGHLIAWAGNLDVGTAGLAGLLFTLFFSYVLFASVEGVFNDIWRAERRRTLTQKFVIFYALVTIVPTLMGLSLYHAARYGLTSGFIGRLGALASVWGALFCAIKLLPATRVSTRAAAVGSLLSAVLFELAKLLFQLYVAKVAFARAAGIYGALALVPILLVWIYYVWTVILVGAEVAHTVQNLRHLEVFDRGARLSPEREVREFVNGVVAARLLGAVAEGFASGAPGVGRQALAVRFDLDEIVVEKIFARLKERGLVIEVEGDAEGYLPARPPADITLHDVLEAFRGSDVVAATASERSRLDQVLGEIDFLVAQRTRAVTLADLVRPKHEGGGSGSQMSSARHG